jgi:hypothetical protein
LPESTDPPLQLECEGGRDEAGAHRNTSADVGVLTPSRPSPMISLLAAWPVTCTCDHAATGPPTVSGNACVSLRRGKAAMTTMGAAHHGALFCLLRRLRGLRAAACLRPEAARAHSLPLAGRDPADGGHEADEREPHALARHARVPPIFGWRRCGRTGGLGDRTGCSESQQKQARDQRRPHTPAPRSNHAECRSSCSSRPALAGFCVCGASEKSFSNFCVRTS